MSYKTLFGIIEFSTPLFCSADVLGQAFDVSIKGHAGTLILPSLPDWSDQEKDPLHKPLLGPATARAWKRGERLIYWGRPDSYPTGDASVERALLEITLCHENLESNSQEVYEGFGVWLDLFEQYVMLLTTQNTRRSVWGGDELGRIELLINEDDKLKHIHRNKSQTINIEMSGVDESLHFEQFKEASRLSSQNFFPRLEYQLILQAYLARKNGDYRKAIIEAANALEISLTDRIKEEFQKQNISFGVKLLDKFRMLGGRFELVRLLGISLPDKDYKKLVINPRNDVVHRAEFPEKIVANQVIVEVKELLQLFSPKVYDDGM